MKILKSKKFATIITLLVMLYFSASVSTESLIKISPQIKIVINILLLIIVAIVNIFSRYKNTGESNPALIKNIKVVSIICGIICFLGVCILKISGII